MHNNNFDLGAACEGGIVGIPAGATEYTDGVSRLGEAIMKEGIHNKPRVITRHCYPYL